MKSSLFVRFTFEKGLMYFLIFTILVVFAFIFYLFFGQLAKNIKIIAPIGGEEWEVGRTYKISWKARGIDSVGIVLFKGNEPKWIAKNVPAGSGSYEWKIYPGQQYGDDYWVAIFEYPWQKNNKIAYSNGAFAIIYSGVFSCDAVSVQNGWPYVPSDFPKIRKVFITENTYNGNLEGLEGADKKCQQEAEAQGFWGSWHAFLGGDSDKDLAVGRIKNTPRKTEGVFVEAESSASLTNGTTCHRLLGKDFNEFIARFSQSSVINERELGKNFSQKLSEVWLGRFDEKSKKNCIPTSSFIGNSYRELAEKYSLTSACQNWTKGNNFVEGYPVPTGQPKPSFPTCFTPEGKLTDAVALGGLAIGTAGGAFTPYQGRSCVNPQRLLCIEE